jgi:hypothetical protein
MTAAGGRKLSPSKEPPNASPPMPSPASTAPTASNGSGVSARTSSMKSVAKMMPASPIGMLIRKIQCQEI